VADQENVAAPGGEGERVEGTAAEGRGRLRFEAERLAGQARRLRRADLGAGEAGVDLLVEHRQRSSRCPRLQLALGSEAARGVVAVSGFGVAVSQEVDHA
jgi:hypothetical protein